MQTAEKSVRPLRSWICGVIGLALAFAGGSCNRGTGCPESRHAPPSQEQAEEPAAGANPEAIAMMGDFARTPDEPHFRELLARARDSDDPAMKLLLDYDEASELMKPVYVRSVDREGLAKRIAEKKPADFRLLASVMVVHQDAWRRWTMAKFLGRYGDKEVLPELRSLLKDPEKGVREHARDTIDEINARDASRLP